MFFATCASVSYFAALTKRSLVYVKLLLIQLRAELLLSLFLFQAGGKGEGVYPAWQDAQQKAQGVH